MEFLKHETTSMAHRGMPKLKIVFGSFAEFCQEKLLNQSNLIVHSNFILHNLIEHLGGICRWVDRIPFQFNRCLWLQTNSAKRKWSEKVHGSKLTKAFVVAKGIFVLFFHPCIARLGYRMLHQLLDLLFAKFDRQVYELSINFEHFLRFL